MAKTFLGVVHLLPLPSSGSVPFDRVMSAALRDAEHLVAGGVDGVMVENFGDAPFHRGTVDDPVPPDVPAGLAVVAERIRREFGTDVGVNCLRNDGIAALGAAAVAGARYVRVNVLTGSYVTDQGLISGEAARIRDYRAQLGLDVVLLADFLVKHATPLGDIDPAVGARDLSERSGASGIVLSGDRTGDAVDAGFLDSIRAALGEFPIFLGSGLRIENAAVLWPRCDGAIVGTALKRDGQVRNPVDPDRVRALRDVLSD